jgi:outer membrane protein OmpA-like peptidoglycan-associated protein
MKQLIALAAVLLGASGAAHSQTTEAQARSYLLTAFVTGAAPTILSADVGLSLGLRERLRLPGEASRDAIYKALSARTEGKSLRVRPATADEAPLVAARAAGHPLFAVEAGDTAFVVAYDLRRDHVPYAGLAGETPPAPAPTLTVFPSAVPVAEVSRPAPATVAAVPPVLRLRPVTFDYNTATLSPQARASLDAELPKLAVASGTRYIVQGYADRIASSRYNQRLSQRRAEAVRDYLVAKGVPADNIQAVGLGSTMPASRCSQKKPSALRACLAPDRRVIVEIRASAT